MALETYSDLKTAVGDYLNRADLTAVIPTFIALSEAKFNRELRTRNMLTRAECVSDNEFVALPVDFLEAYLLELNMTDIAAQQPLAFVGPNEAKSLKANKIINKVRYFTLIDGAFELLPAPTSNVDLLLTYYAKIPSLSDTQTTNWLMTKSPDLYLYSALLEATPYLKNDERVNIWAAARQQVMDAMNIESERSMRQTTQLAARRRGFGL
ncbi:tail tubular protein A [Caudoviricetes sp.]|nr:tail tubular protein A [Caudoviricetes sp.]